MNRSCITLGSVFLLCAAQAVSAFAQGRPEIRADVLVSRTTTVEAGAGVLFPLGNYLRSGVILGGGTANGKASTRADLVASFHLDPFRESKWGPYAGGGISFRHDTGPSRSDAYLLAYLGVEGPPRRQYALAVETGFGGGFRLGVILRKARSEMR